MTQPAVMLPPGGSSLNFLTWNCRGINNPVKRSKVLHHLHLLKAHIVFLQETHLKVSQHLALRCRWVGQVFHSSFQGRARGVAILFHKSIPFTCSNVISDRNGRYVIISGTLFSTKVLLVNIYGPNQDDGDFFKSVFSLLPDMSSHKLILGGDFNCWLDPRLDRSSSKFTALSATAKVIRNFMSEFAISDPLRVFHPTKKAYSFFSPVHHNFTRIDYFLVDDRLLQFTSNCSYNPIVISDHAPVILEISFPTADLSRPPWRLNTQMLSNESFVKFISDQIDFFISTNKTPNMAASTIWETMKAYIRGEVISYTAHENKLRKDRVFVLTRSIAQLDETYAVSPSPDIYKERLILQAKLDTFLTNQVTETLIKTRATYYELGDKASKLLAHKLRQQTSSQQIPKIRTSAGISLDPKVINEEFRNFYQALYTSESTADIADLDAFFNTLSVPLVNNDLVSKLEQPITLEELSAAVKSLQSGKSPGPDGYAVEFYKKFFPQIAQILLDMYNEAFINGNLPLTLTQASISLILKKNKDPLDCASYRPISLLNVDYKILAKLLSTRLEAVLPSVISPDQTGFIKNRHSFFNIRCLFNVIYNPSPTNVSEAVVSLDAEKAFDRVEWRYLFYTLEKFGLGPNFVRWIKLLYSSPQASVRTNNTHSDYFLLHRSTRQGCPLSPLLFALAIEPLAIALRSNPLVSGIVRYRHEQILSMYADDLLLYLSDLSVSVPAVLAVLTTFGHLSGYKLNLNKSELMPLNDSAKSSPLNNFPFKIVQNSFLYLGIQVTDKFVNLFQANFAPLLNRTKNDFDRWSILHLSLAARINSIKMNTLPKFLYLFQCLPIFLPQSFFKKLDGLISSFIWDGKPAKIRKLLLQNPRADGGLALPDFRSYYWACNIRIIQYWLRKNDASPSPTWLEMEAASTAPASLISLIHSSITGPYACYTNNTSVKSTLKVWNQFRHHFGFQTSPTSAPIAANPAFQPGMTDGSFRVWSNLGIRTTKDLYINNTFCTFEQLVDKFGVPKHHFFRYLQIRSYIRRIDPHFPVLPCQTQFDIFLRPFPALKGALTILYRKIRSLQTTSLNSIKLTWEEELHESIPNEIWNSALERIHKSSICARHSLIQCKIIHRAHWTNDRLAKIYKDLGPGCLRCTQSPANHTHMFWACPSLVTFWEAVFSTISDVCGAEIDPHPFIALFGVPCPALQLAKTKKDFIAFVTLLARRLILLKWKSPAPPSYENWVHSVLNCVKLEKIRHTLRGSLSRFNAVWSPFFSYVGRLHFPAVPE